MIQPSRLTNLMTWAAVLSLGLPHMAHAAEAPRPVPAQAARPMPKPAAQRAASQPTSQPLDVRLGAGGEMSAVVRDSGGKPRAGVEVAVLHQDAEVAVAQTDENGAFAIAGLRRGSHIVQVEGSSNPVRLWPHDAAPPQAVETPVFTGVEQGVRLTQATEVYEEGEIVEGRVYEVQQQGFRPAPRRHTPLRRLRNGMSRVFANYPILATTALIGAGIGSGIAIGSDSRPASP